MGATGSPSKEQARQVIGIIDVGQCLMVPEYSRKNHIEFPDSTYTKVGSGRVSGPTEERFSEVNRLLEGGGFPDSIHYRTLTDNMRISEIFARDLGLTDLGVTFAGLRRQIEIMRGASFDRQLESANVVIGAAAGNLWTMMHQSAAGVHGKEMLAEIVGLGCTTSEVDSGNVYYHTQPIIKDLAGNIGVPPEEYYTHGLFLKQAGGYK